MAWTGDATVNVTPANVHWAYNLTGEERLPRPVGSTDSVVCNGVTFARAGGTGPEVEGRFIIRNTDYSLADFVAGMTGASAALAGVSNCHGNPAVLEVFSLAVGTAYQPQVYGVAGRDGVATWTSGTDGAVLDQAQFGAGSHQCVKYDFVADAPTRTITIKPTSTSSLPWGYWQFCTLALIRPSEANVAPTDITLSKTSIAENNAPNGTVGTFSATDANAGQPQVFPFVSGPGDTDNATFAIIDNQLTIKVRADFKAKSSYAIRVRATDTGGLWCEESFVIAIRPTDITLSKSSIREMDPGANVGTLTATDAGAPRPVVFTLVSGAGDNAAFFIAADLLKLVGMADAQAKSSYSVTVRATDASGLLIEKTFTILVHGFFVEPWINVPALDAAKTEWACNLCPSNPTGTSLTILIVKWNFLALAGGLSLPGKMVLSGVSYGASDTNNLMSAPFNATLARDFVYGGNPASILLSGLTSGTLYELLVYSVGYDAPPNHRKAIWLGVTSKEHDQDQYGDNNGVCVHYRFIADATTHRIDVKPSVATATMALLRHGSHPTLASHAPGPPLHSGAALPAKINVMVNRAPNK